MKHLIVILTLTLSSCHVSALDLVVGLYTKHTTDGGYNFGGKRYPYNEKNDFIGVKASRYTLATFNNSYRERSVMAAYTPFNHPYLTLDVGLVSGYEESVFFFSIGVKSKYLRAQLLGGTTISVMATLPI